MLRLANPLRVLVQRFAYLLLIGSAVGFIILGKADSVILERSQTAITDAFAPLLDAISRPVETVGDAVERVRELGRLQDEIARLRAENARLADWETVARRLAIENQSYRELLNVTPDPTPRFVTARVIGDAGGAFIRSVLVNVGSEDGIRKGHAAVNGEGLVGRVTELGHRSARVLLVTDLNSRIPVMIESSRYRAILAGDNSNRPRLLYLSAEATVAGGDWVVTSGHGGVFPVGLPVGVVSSVENGEIRVQPFVTWNRMSHVQLVDPGAPEVIAPLPRAQVLGR